MNDSDISNYQFILSRLKNVEDSMIEINKQIVSIQNDIKWVLCLLRKMDHRIWLIISTIIITILLEIFVR